LKIIPQCDLVPEIAEVRAEVDNAWRRVVDSGHFIMGPEVLLFEHAVQDYLGCKHAVSVASGTDALLIALRSLVIGAGDEVITTPFTFFATVEAIVHAGALPAFCDVDPETLLLDPRKLEACLRPNTKAIVPVHLYGLACNMGEIMAFAKSHGLLVLEDAAQAFGAKLGPRRLGTIGNAGAFSFFPTKNLGGFGDGGMIVTDDDEVAATARGLRVHGARSKYEHERVGYNSRLDELQAAVLRAKLPYVDRWNELRIAAAERYRALLSGIDGIVLPPSSSDTLGHVYHQFTVRVGSGRRDELQLYLKRRFIETAVHYPLLVHDALAFQHPPVIHRRPHLGCPEADRARREVLSLPFWPQIEPETQKRVADAIRAFFG
jgi:dTDP-4-amino-4,6-dideoxygalactose transaminase